MVCLYTVLSYTTLRTLLGAPEHSLDYGVAAIELVLLLQPIEDALCGVALLLRRAQVIFEYAVYDARVRLKLGAMGRRFLRYPGGTGCESILRTVSRCSPNTRDASLMLIPSTRHALRTRKYMSTMYILVTFHQSLDRLYRKVAGGTVFDRHAQAVEPPSRYIMSPPFTGFC